MPCTVDAVLIDDNPWIREQWTVSLSAHGKRLGGFESGEEFLASDYLVATKTPIFVDLKLGDNVCPGEKLLIKLHRGGYRNLFLATAFDTSHLNLNKYLRGIVGKEPPKWLLNKRETNTKRLSSQERQKLISEFSPADKINFKNRMKVFYGAIYGVEGPMALSAIPDTVQTSWEWGIYNSVLDKDLESLIEDGWRQWAQNPEDAAIR